MRTSEWRNYTAAVILFAACAPAVGQIIRVNVNNQGIQANKTVWNTIAISRNGRFVAFVSDATNLDPRDTADDPDLFVYDLLTNHIELVSVDAEGKKLGLDIVSFVDKLSLSEDGRFVAFCAEYYRDSGADQILVKDRQTGEVLLASSRDGVSGGRQKSYSPSLSADGSLVAFESAADNLDELKTGGLFIKNLRTGQLTRAARALGGGAAYGSDLRISGSGQHIVFVSDQNDIVPNDTNNVKDVFIRDLTTGAIARASVNSSGIESDSMSARPDISDDGRYVIFLSFATNFTAEAPAGLCCYLHDRQTSVTRPLYPAAWSPWHYPRITPDGSEVLFWAYPPGNYGTIVSARVSTGQVQQVFPLEVMDLHPNLEISGNAQEIALIGDHLVANDTNNVNDVIVVKRAGLVSGPILMSGNGDVADAGADSVQQIEIDSDISRSADSEPSFHDSPPAACGAATPSVLPMTLAGLVCLRLNSTQRARGTHRQKKRRESESSPSRPDTR